MMPWQPPVSPGRGAGNVSTRSIGSCDVVVYSMLSRGITGLQCRDYQYQRVNCEPEESNTLAISPLPRPAACGGLWLHPAPAVSTMY